jgi:hypothetical protein
LSSDTKGYISAITLLTVYKDVDIAITIGSIAIGIGLVNVVAAAFIWRRRQQMAQYKTGITTETTRLIDATVQQQ